MTRKNIIENCRKCASLTGAMSGVYGTELDLLCSQRRDAFISVEDSLRRNGIGVPTNHTCTYCNHREPKVANYLGSQS